MKLIIAGSRDFIPSNMLIDALVFDFQLLDGIREVVSGGALGVDRAGESWASTYPSDELLVKRFPADWDKYGKAAGPIRNREMAAYADALLLIWNGESRGSKNMREEMLKAKKPVYEVILRRTKP